jgi:type I restriction enzyme S subunit
MTPSRENEKYWGGDIPWISPKDMKVDVLYGSIDRITDLALKETPIALVPAGAVLIVVRGMILARRVPVALTAVDVALNQDMKALLAGSRVLPHYLRWLLNVSQRELLEMIEMSGHGTRKLESSDLLSFRIPVPELEKQREICRLADAQTEGARRAVQKIRREIDLLHEFRTRFVADVVTGQVDVRRIATALPEVDSSGFGDSGADGDLDTTDIDDVIEASES